MLTCSPTVQSDIKAGNRQWRLPVLGAGGHVVDLDRGQDGMAEARLLGISMRDYDRGNQRCRGERSS